MSTLLRDSRSTKQILLQLGAKKHRILQSFAIPQNQHRPEMV
jgi:hypothetical protein